jgi:benzoyl-CoA reductase/2-hydroxyglutaryl-CoA dehydratase subunit BcrC/BadD/HgdB
MNLPNLPGFERLSFDTELKSFNGIMSLFLNSSDRVKASGKKVVAKSPLTPVDPIYAAGALAYDPYTNETIVNSVINENYNLTGEALDAGLNSDFNPWNLIMLGSVFSGKNNVPIDVYSTACGCWDDQIKKCWQIMAEVDNSPLYFWEIPRFESEAEKWALDFLTKELKHLLDFLASQTGKKITDEAIGDAIRRGNLLRQDLLDLTRLLQSSIIPIPALEFYIAQLLISDYAQDPEALHNQYRQLIGELEERVKQGVAAPGITSDKPTRIYLMGDETQEFQLFNVIEQYGGTLVGCDSRLSLYYEPIKESDSAIDALARWIWNMPHNLPTADRVKATIPYIKQQKPDAVIISNVVGSRNLPGAERLVRDMIREELSLPVLSIETSLPLEDIEKVDYQIRAFIEMNAY